MKAAAAVRPKQAVEQRLKRVAARHPAVRAAEAVARFALAVWSLSLFGAGFWWGFVDREHQFLHDRLIGSRLYRTG